jgi:hypothetical protein
MTSTTPYGFRVVGSPFADRLPVDWERAFRAYADCDERAETHREAYLSAFTFGADFRRLLESTGTPRGYTGACGSPWLWFDIDREGDLDAATRDARRLAAGLLERYRTLDAESLLLFFSGAKGYHAGLPLSLCGSPAPAVTFNAVARRFAETTAERLGFAIDAGVYDRVRLFRAPNSRHPKTGLHKRRLAFDELLNLGTPAILRLAEQPEAFDLPTPPGPDPQAADDWRQAAEQVAQAATAHRCRQATGNGAAKLNRLTLAVIRGELPTGDRHRLLFSASANLAEFGCSLPLACQLLTDAGLDAGLSPSEVRRQIDRGLAAGSPSPSLPTGGRAPPSEPDDGTATPPDLPPTGPATAPTNGTGSPAGKDTATAAELDLPAALARLWRQAGTPKLNQTNNGGTP